MQTTGARYIVQFLESRGVKTVAGIPGGSILPLYDALAQRGTIRHVLARHEQGAAFMAQGMARLTGRPGVCLATSGPGATNLVTAIADARRDGVPLVCITGQVPLAQIGTEAFQEVDIVAVAGPLTKYSRMVRSASELPEALEEAFEAAVTGRPGPVLLDVPKDVQTGRFTPPALSLIPGEPPARPAPSRWDVSRAAALVNAARRPVLLLGGGASRGRAPELARRLAEKAGLPVTMTLTGLGALPDAHPLCLGMHGMHGHARANRALDACDLLLAVGSRFDDRATGRPETFCPGARIVHVNVDAAELGRIKRAEVAVESDAAHFLEALLPLVERRARGGWLAEVEGLDDAPMPRLPEARREEARPPHEARELVARVAERLRDDAVVVTDVGQHQMVVAQDFPFRNPGRFLTSGGLGVMGFGLPAAIGAALAEPGAQVVCFSGDGSFKMNVQELATLAETGANVKVVVLDNRSLGLVSQQQRLFYGGRRTASRFEGGTDFAALARAFGIAGVSLEAEEDWSRALDEALSRPGPALVHARVDAEAMVFPMVPPGASNREMLTERPDPAEGDGRVDQAVSA
ncbi:Acetolactate synthase isozyme 1 large subunit [Fundidesulfovibrio magnetotacticus]|uniref:Acetolactate synthase n=1 Tax=Fundidesulfovibrio magnetotacticus TaxID=2730080 RepID=A0A6V8LXJ4_9BACT|nr:biosynthetic-type acetolactate synthase large subunit [Fundidesulfovibrio magnetotacticus]GFK94978.1 Acetolactate synthase isozyme 1 large subunit [Fundidesulfovibrio magnetotacticus]